MSECRCRVTVCYEIVTPESAANGDFADSGVLFPAQEYSLRDLVGLFRSDIAEYSVWPVEASRSVWAISHTDVDYEDMSEERWTYHCHADATPREVRVWEWALRLAN